MAHVAAVQADPPAKGHTGAQALVGKQQDNRANVQESDDGVTVMLKSIACLYTQEDVKSILDSLGLMGKYNVIYIPRYAPRSRRRPSNLGYAFVNFLKPEYVEECRQVCDGKIFGWASTKECQVVLAHSQDCKRKATGKGWRAAPLIIDVEEEEKKVVDEMGLPAGLADLFTGRGCEAESYNQVSVEPPPVAVPIAEEPALETSIHDASWIQRSQFDFGQWDAAHVQSRDPYVDYEAAPYGYGAPISIAEIERAESQHPCYSAVNGVVASPKREAHILSGIAYIVPGAGLRQTQQAAMPDTYASQGRKQHPRRGHKGACGSSDSGQSNFDSSLATVSTRDPYGWSSSSSGSDEASALHKRAFALSKQRHGNVLNVGNLLNHRDPVRAKQMSESEANGVYDPSRYTLEGIQTPVKLGF